MKVQISEPCLIRGKHTEPGEVLDCDEGTARLLMQIGRAIPFIPVEVEPEETKPRKRGRPRKNAV